MYLGGASGEVTREVIGKDDADMDHHPDTGISPGLDEMETVLIVTVTSKEDINLSTTARVTLNSGLFVSEVIIEDGEVINLNQGKTYTPQATVEGPAWWRKRRMMLSGPLKPSIRKVLLSVPTEC
jgi:hypothetical protein